MPAAVESIGRGSSENIRSVDITSKFVFTLATDILPWKTCWIGEQQFFFGVVLVLDIKISMDIWCQSNKPTLEAKAGSSFWVCKLFLYVSFALGTDSQIGECFFFYSVDWCDSKILDTSPKIKKQLDWKSLLKQSRLNGFSHTAPLIIQPVVHRVNMSLLFLQV